MSVDTPSFATGSEVHEALSAFSHRSTDNISTIVAQCWSAAALQEVLIFVGLHDPSLLVPVAALVDLRRHQLLRMWQTNNVRLPVDVAELETKPEDQSIHPLVVALLAIATRGN